MLPAERSSMKVYMFICINYTKTKKTAVVAHTFKIWEAAGFSAVKAQKKKVESFRMGQKHRSWRTFFTSF